MLAWLTPDLSLLTENPEIRTIELPGSLWYLVSGAIGELSMLHRWEQQGTATPEEMAAYFHDVYEAFLMSSANYIGEFRPFIFSPPPPKWLPMDDNVYDEADYPELYAVIPEEWRFSGVFYLPSLAGAALIGGGSGGFGTFPLNSFGGAASHTLAVTEMPSHTHTYFRAAPGNHAGGTLAVVPMAISQSLQTATTGGGLPHNNMPPYLAVNWAIYAGR